MFTIKGFFFVHLNTGSFVRRSNPYDAIEYFESKGWGMHNFTIKVLLESTGVHDNAECDITLAMFNYLTDTWEQQSKSEAEWPQCDTQGYLGR